MDVSQCPLTGKVVTILYFTSTYWVCSAGEGGGKLTQPLPLKIFHRLLERRGIAAVGRVLRNTRGDCPKPLLILRPLRVEHDTADVPMAFEHVIFVR
jgi:hypothetical protein